MKPTAIWHMAVDAAMTVVLLCLMAYSLLGETAHEWLGMGMCALFIAHHVLNRKWTRRLFRGRYTAFRAAQTALALLILVGVLGSALSGIAMSKHLFAELRLPVPASVARKVHMLCAYWGFVCMSLHWGFTGTACWPWGEGLWARRRRERTGRFGRWAS